MLTLVWVILVDLNQYDNERYFQGLGSRFLCQRLESKFNWHFPDIQTCLIYIAFTWIFNLILTSNGSSHKSKHLVEAAEKWIMWIKYKESQIPTESLRRKKILRSRNTQRIVSSCVELTLTNAVRYQYYFLSFISPKKAWVQRWEYQTTLPVSWKTCESRSNSWNWACNNWLVQNWERSIH